MFEKKNVDLNTQEIMIIIRETASRLNNADNSSVEDYRRIIDRLYELKQKL